MGRKKEDLTVTDLIEKFYWFLKRRVNFDDLQATVLITSLIVLPISIMFGFFYKQDVFYRNIFFVAIAVDFLTVVYTIIKIKYFRDKKISDIAEFKKKKVIEVKTIDDIRKLNSNEFEAFVDQVYKAKGFKTELTPISHDHGADLIAIKDNEKYVIQVKTSIHSIKKDGIYSAEEARDYYHSDYAVVVANNVFTDRAILTAQRYDVKLINIHELDKFLRKNQIVTIKSEDYFKKRA
ncbi:restriction endonuclease [Acholeplasma equirhinis]|uniref:restriction endonuclease n=1 Tax=Acholeplasma equirhinis TaxID=555393 RepID=UPI00197AB156|nr:restriction endonuclease [Acholeplasma equirhinis]MBN3490964.1 restriction endonuclease [Acholeplasma equirhinis]